MCSNAWRVSGKFPFPRFLRFSSEKFPILESYFPTELELCFPYCSCLLKVEKFGLLKLSNLRGDGFCVFSGSLGFEKGCMLGPSAVGIQESREQDRKQVGIDVDLACV